MITAQKDTTSLIDEHDVIQGQIDFLTASLERLAARPLADKEDIRNWRYGLYDLREGLQRYAERDEYILTGFANVEAITRNQNDHREISRQLDAAIYLTNLALDTNQSPAELKQSITGIKSACGKVRLLLKNHTTQENKLLYLSVASG